MALPLPAEAPVSTMGRARVVVCSLAVASGLAVVPAAQQHVQFRAGINNVPVYVTATDARGQLVTDLTQEEFELFDNGQPQPITTFASNWQPITVVVMLDRSGSVEEHFALIAGAAAEFVQHLTPEDSARIGSFAARVQIDPVSFTNDRTSLLEILKNDLQPAGPTPLWNATNAAMTALAAQPGRRVVLVFTDGFDSPPWGPLNVNFSDIRRRAEEEEIMVYGVGLVRECNVAPSRAPTVAPSLSADALFQLADARFQRRRGGGVQRPRGLPGMPGGLRLPGRMPTPLPPPRVPRPAPPVFTPSKPSTESTCTVARPDPNLRTLADVSGGGYFELSKATDLSTAFARVADELHRQYLLGFVAPASDGRLHRLEVRVKRPGVQVKARKSYMAPR